MKDTLTALPSDKQRIAYLAEVTADITDLEYFPQYLTLLFEIDALFLKAMLSCTSGEMVKLSFLASAK